MNYISSQLLVNFLLRVCFVLKVHCAWKSLPLRTSLVKLWDRSDLKAEGKMLQQRGKRDGTFSIQLHSGKLKRQMKKLHDVHFIPVPGQWQRLLQDPAGCIVQARRVHYIFSVS